MTDDTTEEQKVAEKTRTGRIAMDPVRKWTLIILGLCIILFVMYLVGDRRTPYTTQARLHAYVIPIAAQLSGNVTEVGVTNNQVVKAGDLLFRIDPSNYQLAVDSAAAGLKSVLQSVEAGQSNVDAARARVESAQASVWRAEQDAARMRKIRDEDPGAISQRRIDSAEAGLAAAKGSLSAAEANLEAARQALGATDESNAQVMQARAALHQAQINLERTTVVAPRDGLVTDLRIDKGHFAAAGAPLMTFIAIHDTWVRADLTENNLGNVDIGDRAELTFDMQPGRVFKGRVRATGFGVQVDSNPLGTLPTISNQRSWLRDAQRFPVIIEVDEHDQMERLGLRVGSQVSVIVYTGDHWLINLLGKLYIRVSAVLSYAY